MKSDVLVVGSGMYVLGKDEDDFGTILPTLATEQQSGRIGKIVVCSSKVISSQNAKKRAEVLGEKLKYKIDVEFYPEKIDNKEEYFAVLENNKNIKLGVVSVPDHLHFKVTKDLLRKKISCLVVKPFTTNLSEALELTKIADEYSLWGAVEFHKRFDSANLLMRDACLNGKIGDPLYFVVEYSQRRMIPEQVFSSWSSKTNIFQYLGVHYVDLIYFISQARPIRVSATSQQKLLKDTPDSIQANIEWELKSKGKFNSIIITNWIDPNTTSAMSDQKIKVVGTEGRIESDQKNRGLQAVGNNGIEDINPYFSKIFSNANGVVKVDGYGPSSIRQFISDATEANEGFSVRGNSASFKDALVSTAVIEAVTASINGNSSWITIDTNKFSELFE